MKPTISLPLDIPDVKILQTRINRAGDIVISVESTLKGTKCRRCERKVNQSHGHDDWVELQHLPILGTAKLYSIATQTISMPHL